MFCPPGCLRTFVFVLLLVLLPLSEASAHCFVGARFFPATLATDDPCVADEMSLPTVAWSRTGDIPPATQWAISGDLAKRITEDFGISIGEGWTQIGHSGGPTMAGFGDLETTFQYQLRKRRPPPRWHTEPARRPQTDGASERSAALCQGRRDERGQAGDYMLRLSTSRSISRNEREPSSCRPCAKSATL